MSETAEPRALRCMEIQGGNTPVELSLDMPGLDLWISSHPHEDAAEGGDVHYVSLCGGGIVTRLILADVSGHGATVGDLSRALRGLMRKHINRKSQTRLVQELNRAFAELGQCFRFATAVVATYLANRRELTICNAGHPRPLYRPAAEGTWRLLLEDESAGDRRRDKPSNLPLGIDEESDYPHFTAKLGPGDLVVIYTDALIEATAPDSIEPLGESGLLALVADAPLDRPGSLGQSVLDAVARFRGGRPSDDDVSILVIHHRGDGPKRMGLGEKLDVYAKVFGLKSV